jgi:hypothetical protein
MRIRRRRRRRRKRRRRRRSRRKRRMMRGRCARGIKLCCVACSSGRVQARGIVLARSSDNVGDAAYGGADNCYCNKKPAAAAEADGAGGRVLLQGQCSVGDEAGEDERFARAETRGFDSLRDPVASAPGGERGEELGGFLLGQLDVISQMLVFRVDASHVCTPASGVIWGGRWGRGGGGGGGGGRLATAPPTLPRKPRKRNQPDEACDA